MAGSPESFPFITKVVPPKHRADTILRASLLTDLHAGLTARVQVIWAPAGFGKTTVLTQFVSELRLPVAWYTLTPDDNEAATFIGCCIKASEPVFGQTGSLNETLWGPVTRQQWRRALGRLITKLSALPYRVLFVIDDLHHVDAYPEVQEALNLFIERAPDNVHFILGTRTRPSLDCLPRLSVEDTARFKDANALRFSDEETALLLSNAWKRPVELPEAKALREMTGGWAAGIALLSRSPDLVRNLARENNLENTMLFDYLTREVLGKVSLEHRRFLVRTSILAEFTADLCNQLLERTDSQRLLNELKDGGYFLEERPSSISTYSYHELFRASLDRMLHAEAPDVYLSLQRTAAALATARSDHGAAIRHLLSAGEPHEAAQVVRTAANSYLERGRWQTVQAWLFSLPSEILANDAELLLILATVQLRLGQTMEAVGSLDRIAKHERADSGLIGRALVTRSFANRLLGNLDLAVQNAKEGLDKLRASNARARDMADGFRQLASALSTGGDFQEGRRNFEQALALAPDGDMELRSLIRDGLAAVCLELGKLDEAAVFLNQARQGWLKLRNDGALATTLNNLAVAYYWRGEFDLALDEVREAQRAAASAGNQRFMAGTLITQGIIQRAQKQYEAAIDSFMAGLEGARSVLDQRSVAEATTGLGNTYRRMGEPGKAEVLLKEALIQAQQSGQNYIAARYQAALGKVYCQQGALSDALHNLEQAVQSFGQQGSLRGVTEAKLHQALATYRMGKTQQALSLMQELATLLSQLGYEGFLLADADEALEVLRLSVAKGIGIRPLGRILRRLKPAAEVGVEPTTMLQRPVMPPLKVFGFGQATVFLQGHQVTDRDWDSRKAKELFFLLLCRRGFASKDFLIEALWPDATGRDLGHALRTNVYRVRRSLYPQCVIAEAEGYRLNPETPVEFDYYAFEDLVNRTDGNEGGHGKIERLLQAIELYSGPFLEEFYSDWCEPIRRTLEVKYLHALMVLANYYASRGNFSRSIEVAEKVASANPYDEPAHLLVANGYLKLGDPLTATRHLREYATRLREELQTQPSAEFLDIYRHILRQGPLAPANSS